VKITVYELSGRRLVTLVSRDYDAGEHHVDWDGTDRTGRRVASGVYLGRFEMHGRVHTTRITMVK
jgi:flagellar hook assembly protein FlgD